MLGRSQKTNTVDKAWHRNSILRFGCEHRVAAWCARRQSDQAKTRAGWMRRCAIQVATRRISLGRPAGEGVRGSRRDAFGGDAVFARWRTRASMAKASTTSETWRYQPCRERLSLWSKPSSFFAVSKASSMVQRF